VKFICKYSSTRSQAVATIADRTASQQTIYTSDCCEIAAQAVFEILIPDWGHEFDLSGSREVIGHRQFFTKTHRLATIQYTDRRQTDGHNIVA